MSRLVLFATLALVFCHQVCAQSKSFLILSPAELDMTECSFDKEASAVMLLNEGSSDYNNNYGLMNYYHYRIKILKQDGIQYGNVTIPYISENEFEYIDDIAAVTVNVDDGKQTEHWVDKKNLYFKKIDNYRSELSFALPQVRVGSIIEYKYRSNMKHYGGLRDWNFQSNLPVCVTTYDLRPPPNLEFTYLVQKDERFPIDVKPSEGMVSFRMNNIPGLGDEPFMDAREDYIQKIHFQITKFSGIAGAQKHMASWNQVAQELLASSSYGVQLKANISDEAALLVASLAGKSELEKLHILYNYVRATFKWNDYIGKYPDPAVKTLWSKKSGNAAAINFALITLLREAKMEAWPLLVSDRGNGKINVKTPFISQFNNSYAVVVIDGKNYFLDATEAHSAAGIVPYNILNTTALILKGRNGIITEVTESEIGYQENILVNSSLDETGKLSGKVHIMSKGYARRTRLDGYQKNHDQYIQRQLLKGWSNLKVDSLEVLHIDDDTLAFEQKFNYSTAIQQTGEYGFISLNLFSGFETNPFLSQERFSNINFGHKRALVLNCMVRVPGNVVVDELPKSIKLVNEDRTVSFTRELFYSKESGQLAARIKINFEKSLFTVAEYPALKEFYKKIIDLMNEQVVVKKNS